MAVLWYPGQDVDFLARLKKIEEQLDLLNEVVQTKNNSYTVTELVEENAALQRQILDLEEIVLNISEKIGELGVEFPA